MNTYRDNVDFLQTLGCHLENQLCGDNSSDSLTPVTFQTHNCNVQSLLSEEMCNQLQSLADPKIKLQFLTISSKLVSRLAQSRPHTPTNAFWDAGSHQTDIQDSFQFLLPLSYLQRLLPRTFPTPEEDLVKSFEAVCTQIQTVFGPSNYAANCLSVKLLLILERMQQYWTAKWKTKKSIKNSLRCLYCFFFLFLFFLPDLIFWMNCQKLNLTPFTLKDYTESLKFVIVLFFSFRKLKLEPIIDDKMNSYSTVTWYLSEVLMV